jgi:hypothetical protein
MTINSETRRTSTFYGDGLTTVFPFAFKLFNGSQAVVVMSSNVTGDLPLTFGVDYTVALNADQDVSPGGNVTLLQPLALGFALTIKSGVPYNQLINITNPGGFYPTVVNDGFDKLTILIQQVIDQILHPEETPALSRISYIDTLPVSGTSVTVDFPDQQFVVEPSALITINGAPTDVSWTFTQSVVSSVTYYTSMTITFQALAVGSTYTLIVVSND